MKAQKYPIGVQTFQEIIEGGYNYVDKTSYIPLLIKKGKYIFLSRPRRFGKSLLLSTLHSYFEGRRDLFKGLAIEGMDVDWTPRPVIHIDFNAENYQMENGLEIIINSILKRYEKSFGVDEVEASFAQRFRELISIAHERTGEKVSILVDEYDKPLLNIEDKPELFAKNQAILKGLFGVLKTMDPHICFAMLSGVARFNKVSIFSDLNNLNDISMDKAFADICGWTQEEMEAEFRPGIELLAEENDMSYEETVEKMKRYYDGYLFAAKGSLLYNPFSVLVALDKSEIEPYWFRTGTPTFLAKRISQRRMLLPDLNESVSSKKSLLSVGLDDADPVPLLFQTGYLTLQRIEGQRCYLHFPNLEVEVGFAEELVPFYVPSLEHLSGEFSIWKFQDEIIAGEPEAFMKRMEAMIKDVPYEQHNEKFYQNVVYLLFTLVGADARVEEHTNRGRSDLVVRTKEYIYIFEFKYNGSVEEAMEQIEERDYAGRFATYTQQIFKIGANFTTAAHGLEGWEIRTEGV